LWVERVCLLACLFADGASGWLVFVFVSMQESDTAGLLAPRAAVVLPVPNMGHVRQGKVPVRVCSCRRWSGVRVRACCVTHAPVYAHVCAFAQTGFERRWLKSAVGLHMSSYFDENLKLYHMRENSAPPPFPCAGPYLPSPPSPCPLPVAFGLPIPHRRRSVAA
jgi:hypothetical protein